MATKRGDNGVKQIAVDNFLMSLGSSSENDVRMNLEQDARSYRWNTATVKAIDKGITAHFKAKK